MPVTEIGDPRLQALFGADDPREAGARPVVSLPRKGLPPAVIAVIIALVAAVLFVVLNQRRLSQSQSAPDTITPAPGTAEWAAPPPLYIPPEPAPVMQAPVLVPQSTVLPRPVVVAQPAPSAKVAAQPLYAPVPVAPLPPPPVPQARVAGGTALVVDTTNGQAAALSGNGSAPSALVPSGQTGRMRASALANRSTTVPQGYLIPAVLETGFNSTQPGFARAIVSREVRSFDGSNVLIPRGSRLIGEYRSDVAQGQKRAVILWTRLIRPDGMTITLDSPAVDTLGRGGVPASVNTHFWQRLGDALLQTTIGVGTALAQRSVSGPVIVLPGNGQLAPQTSSNNYVPTLTVPAGKSISVFVAHDLDFSSAGSHR